jgi:phosphonate transport system substrate-binding protein
MQRTIPIRRIPAWRSLMALLLLLFAAAGCERAHESAGPTYGKAQAGEEKPIYRFAIHPLHNPAKLFESYQPLIDYLDRQVPDAKFVLEASLDYQDFERKFRQRAPAFILPNPWQTLEAMKVGYRVIAMAGDAEDFKGIFIVRRDSGIAKPADLKGKAVSYPSPTALAACIMPQYWLHEQGIDVKRDIRNLYVGSQESAIMNAFLGQSAAGATWPPPWRAFQNDHPREAAEMIQIWETPPLLNNAFMVRDDVPAPVVAKVRSLLVGLGETQEGQDVLAKTRTARFHPADDASYARVRKFIERFEREVRPVEAK